MSGRTSWWAHDHAWHRREAQVELAEEHGPAGPHLLSVLTSWAQEQGSTGAVKGGFRALGREAFVDPGLAERIIRDAAQIGAVKDLEVDGLRFTLRVSGWTEDQRRARATARKQAERGRVAATVSRSVTDRHAMSRDVAPSAESPDGEVVDAEIVPSGDGDWAAGEPAPYAGPSDGLGPFEPNWRVATPPSRSVTPSALPDQTIPIGGGSADACERACAGLAAAGFTADEIAADRGAIAVELAGRPSLPDDIDWAELGQRLKRRIADGKFDLDDARPVTGLRFILNGRGGLPRIGGSKHLFGDKPLTPQQRLNESRLQAVRGTS